MLSYRQADGMPPAYTLTTEPCPTCGAPLILAIEPQPTGSLTAPKKYYLCGRTEGNDHVTVQWEPTAG